MTIDIATAMSPAESQQLQALAAGQVVLELGADQGYSTILLSQVAERVHSVDFHRDWDPRVWRSSLEGYFGNLRRFNPGNVVSHVGSFAEVLPLFRPAWFDGGFLDAVHFRANVEADLGLLEPLVKPGGWIAFHDYGADYFDRERWAVAEVVDAWATERGVAINKIDMLAWARLPEREET